MSIFQQVFTRASDNKEYTVHKIAHAAAGCATAAIVNKSNCEAGAIGAGVGEIIAGLMIPEGNGLVVGRMSKDGKLIWRLDYDPEKGPHFNIEDY